jgi:hypothetical protein
MAVSWHLFGGDFSGFREKTAGDAQRGGSAERPHRLAIKKAADVLNRVGEIAAVILLGNVAEVRRDHDIIHLAEWMIERQRLDIEDIETGAGDLVLSQRGDEGGFIDDRPA